MLICGPVIGGALINTPKVRSSHPRSQFSAWCNLCPPEWPMLIDKGFRTREPRPYSSLTIMKKSP
jgi:hypothetical protein